MCITTNESFTFLPFAQECVTFLSHLFLVRYFFRSRLQEAKKCYTKQAQKNLEIKWVHSYPPVLLETLRKLTPTQTLNWKSFQGFKNISKILPVYLYFKFWQNEDKDRYDDLHKQVNHRNCKQIKCVFCCCYCLVLFCFLSLLRFSPHVYLTLTK